MTRATLRAFAALAIAVSFAAAQVSTASSRLRAGDVVEITVGQERVAKAAIEVRPNGQIHLPLAGEIQAAGLTIGELERACMRALGEYIDTPRINIRYLGRATLRPDVLRPLFR
jgi:polysaccharide export outer membrane protein